MANKHHQLKHLIFVDAAQAKTIILDALKAEGMHRAKAATRLGCSSSTLWTWINQLEMTKAIEQLTKRAIKEGWFHGQTGGRPKGKRWSKSEREARGKPKTRSSKKRSSGEESHAP